MAEPELTREAKEAIRAYMLKLVALPGISLSIVAFLLGFFIRDVAVKQAQYEAYNQVSKDVIQLTKDMETSSTDLGKLKERHKLESDRLSQLSTSASTFAGQVSDFNERLKVADNLVSGLLKDKETKLAALAALEKYPKAEQLMAGIHRSEKAIAAMFEEVRTKKLVISDGKGNERIALYVAEPNTHFIMFDPSKERRTEIRADQYGGFIEFESGPQSRGTLQFHKGTGVNSIANK